MTINTESEYGILGNHIPIPREIKDLICDYANIRFHNNKITTKFHPKDPRVTMLSKMIHEPFDYNEDCIMVLIRITPSHIYPRNHKYLYIQKIFSNPDPHYTYHVNTYCDSEPPIQQCAGVYSYPYPY